MRRGLAVLLSVALSSRARPAAAEDETQAGGPRLTTARAEALVHEISATVEHLRGLRFKAPVAMQVISGATARENFKAKIEPGAEERTRQVQAAYVQLGLVPASTDLNKGYLEFAEKGVAGYYEHGSKTFYLVDHTSPEDVRGVIAHELTHALEDQTYDLDAVVKKVGGTADGSTAVTALIEGSAMVVMYAFLSREEGQRKAGEELEKAQSQRVERFRVAPSFTQRTLTLPYVLGFTFLLHGKPWEWAFGNGVVLSDITRAYAAPPHSTREILHPEQYWDGHGGPFERLTLPDLSSAFGKGWTKTMEGSIGELGLAVLTGSREPIELPWALLPSRWTNEAAAGTTGDVYQHYVNGDRSATVLLTRWETERDGWQFQEALAGKGRRFAQFGTNVLVLAGDFAGSADALALAAFQGMSSSSEP